MEQALAELLFARMDVTLTLAEIKEEKCHDLFGGKQREIVQESSSFRIQDLTALTVKAMSASDVWKLVEKHFGRQKGHMFFRVKSAHFNKLFTMLASPSSTSREVNRSLSTFD